MLRQGARRSSLPGVDMHVPRPALAREGSKKVQAGAGSRNHLQRASSEGSVRSAVAGKRHHGRRAPPVRATFRGPQWRVRYSVVDRTVTDVRTHEEIPPADDQLDPASCDIAAHLVLSSSEQYYMSYLTLGFTPRCGPARRHPSRISDPKNAAKPALSQGMARRFRPKTGRCNRKLGGFGISLRVDRGV